MKNGDSKVKEPDDYLESGTVAVNMCGRSLVATFIALWVVCAPVLTGYYALVGSEKQLGVTYPLLLQ